MHNINQDRAQMLTDTAESGGPGAGVPSVVPGGEPAGLSLWGARCLCKAAAKHTLDAISAFRLFP